MNQQLLHSTMQASIDRIMETFEKKNAQYAPDRDSEGGDALRAFRRAAALDGTTMEATLWGFLKKHLVSLGDLALSYNVEDIPRDVWEEKIGDMIVYGLLLEAIVSERRPIIDCGRISITPESTKMVTTDPAGESISQTLHTS